VALGSYFSPPDATYPVTNTFNDYYKAWVDEAINNKGWVIFVIHPAAAEFNAAQQGYLADTINYAKSQNVPIMTMSEALDEIGNAIDVGDNGTDTATPYFMVGVDGKVQGSGIGDIPCNFNYAYDANSPANSFPSGKITVTPIGYSSATGFPRNEAGLLITSTIGAEKGYWYQEYHVYNTNQIYKRGCRNSDGIWWTWKRIDSFSSEFQTVTESSNIYTLNLTTGENFAIETGNSVAKSIAFSNVPATTNSLLSVSVKLKYTNAAAITHPAGTVWQGGAVPTFSAGKQYLLLYVSYDNGNTWLGYATQGW
jgi:hypothetical protein